MYDGRVLWSDLDTGTTQALSEFTSLQETQAVRALAVTLMRSMGEF